MKYVLTLTTFVILTAANLSAMPNEPTGGTAKTGQPVTAQPASFGDEDTAIHRPTPTPGPSQVNPKDKKPLTASLGKDNTGKSSTTVFATTDPKIYLVWRDDLLAKGSKVHVAWYAEDTGGAISKNKKLTEFTQTTTGDGANGALYLPASTKGFPAGQYRVEFSENGKVVKSLKFTVKK